MPRQQYPHDLQEQLALIMISTHSKILVQLILCHRVMIKELSPTDKEVLVLNSCQTDLSLPVSRVINHQYHYQSITYGPVHYLLGRGLLDSLGYGQRKTYTFEWGDMKNTS